MTYVIPNTFANSATDIPLSSLDENFNFIINILNSLTTELNKASPLGLIGMFEGLISNIPDGWVLCDGSNGTPDLRDKFIIGSSVDSGGESVTSITGVNTKTGGSKDAIVVEHTHGITDPGHSHSYQNRDTAQDTSSGSNTRPRALMNQTTGFSTTGITINSTGSSGTNANLPPYYALAFIMRKPT
jgi:microcystin-dependent protein